MDRDYKLHPVREEGPGGWLTSTRYLEESPGNWNAAERTVQKSVEEQNLRAQVIRKRRSIGMVPNHADQYIPREALDETVLRITEVAQKMHNGVGPNLPYCAFNGGRDIWLDVGNKRVGVHILQSYLGVASTETLHIGDQFLNTGNDFAARDVCPCVWITSPEETTYILKSILRLAGVSQSAFHLAADGNGNDGESVDNATDSTLIAGQDGDANKPAASVDFTEIDRRTEAVKCMDVYTGEIIHGGVTKPLPTTNE